MPTCQSKCDLHVSHFCSIQPMLTKFCICTAYKVNVFNSVNGSSALDKLFGSIGYLRNLVILNCILAKTIAYFHIFLCHVFSVITRFLIARSHRECACIFIQFHRLPFLSIKLADFIVTEAYLIPLLTFDCVHFAKFHLYHSVFPRNTGLGTDILFIKLELYCALASKKKSIPNWHLFITQMETKWTKWYAMT